MKERNVLFTVCSVKTKQNKKSLLWGEFSQNGPEKKLDLSSRASLQVFCSEMYM